MLQILAASLTGILQKDDNLLSLWDSGRFGKLLTCLGVSGRPGFESWQPLYLSHPGRIDTLFYLFGSLWEDGIRILAASIPETPRKGWHTSYLLGSLWNDRIRILAAAFHKELRKGLAHLLPV
jgi:hypothetical protein